MSFQKNYFLQWNATAAGSSQSNISRLYILKKQSFEINQLQFKKQLKSNVTTSLEIIRNQSSEQQQMSSVKCKHLHNNTNTTPITVFSKNYFLQWNATAAGSSQSNVSRLYILKKQSTKFTKKSKSIDKKKKLIVNLTK